LPGDPRSGTWRHVSARGGDDGALAGGGRGEDRPCGPDLLPLFADERGCLYSEYQPIVSLPQRATVGYEALLRAPAPDDRKVTSDVLFPAAEAAGWTHVLDRVGRTTALRDAGSWLGEALLFVNFIPTSIYRPEVCLRTTELAAHKAGVRLSQVVFEVTESHQVTDPQHLSPPCTCSRPSRQARPRRSGRGCGPRRPSGWSRAWRPRPWACCSASSPRRSRPAPGWRTCVGGRPRRGERVGAGRCRHPDAAAAAPSPRAAAPTPRRRRTRPRPRAAGSRGCGWRAWPPGSPRAARRRR